MEDIKSLEYKNASKYRNFCFTWMENKNEELPSESDLLEFLHENFDDYAFQLERGESTDKLHYQGVLRTNYRVRRQTVLKKFQEKFPETQVQFLTIINMLGKWEESLAYCSKDETAVGDLFVSPSISSYTGSDLRLFTVYDYWFPWQKKVKDMMYKKFPMQHIKAPDRQVMWIQDVLGCSGKSKFAKYICFKDKFAAKLPFGTSNQMRSSIIAGGPKKIYFIDIPRTLGKEDDMDAVISVIEDLKNGFICTAMYGKAHTLMMDTPHVVVFSNIACPIQKMSRDRWINYYIDRDTKDINTI